MIRALIGAGPGKNAEIPGKALDSVRSFGPAAERDYPQQILEDVNMRLVAWFGDRQWQGDDAELRRSLLEHVDQLALSWEHPVGG